MPCNWLATLVFTRHTTSLEDSSKIWWPEMSWKSRKAVLDCAHWCVANTASHQAQQVLGALLSMDKPFDVISTTDICTSTQSRQRLPG